MRVFIAWRLEMALRIPVSLCILTIANAPVGLAAALTACRARATTVLVLSIVHASRNAPGECACRERTANKTLTGFNTTMSLFEAFHLEH